MLNCKGELKRHAYILRSTTEKLGEAYSWIDSLEKEVYKLMEYKEVLKKELRETK